MKGEDSTIVDFNSALDFEVLPEESQSLLAEAVDEYVIALEEGSRPDRNEFLKRFESIREQLNAYLDQIDWLSEESHTSSAIPSQSSIATSTGLAYEDFEIDVELGRGAMGIVYRAFQKSLERWVAIKVLPYGTLLDEQRTERFWREAKIAGALEHPGIVSVYGFGRHKDICFYAMPLVEGHSLDRHILAPEIDQSSDGANSKVTSPPALSLIHGPNRYQVIAKLVAEAADAIHAAHGVGVIHRDIKPSNLIVDSQGRVKVTDFGLAIDTADLALTRSGEVVGTIRYMSPEQAAGKRGLVDRRSDVYCLGATLYELMTLRPPFDSESLPEVVRKKEAGILTPPRSIDATIPRSLQTIALKAMRAEPVDRYQSAIELADDLHCFLAGQPISAVDMSIFQKATCWSRRNTGIVLTGVICLALLFAVAVAFNFAQKSQKTALENALIDRERHFQSARRAVDQLGIEFAEKLETIPEATELRRDLLRSSLSYYSEFLSESKDDARLTQAVAEAKWKTAQATAGLETLVEAAQLYEAADKELSELIDGQPHLTHVRAEMLSEWAMRYMGRFQGEASDPAAALSVLERMSSDDERLPASCRALLKNNLAFVLASLRRTQESLRFASEAVELLRQASRDASSESNARSLCVSMLNLSQALDDAGQTATALDVAQQCAVLTESLPSSYSAIPATQIRARALATLAALKWKSQGANAAVKDLQAVVDIHVAQLEAWPSSIEFRWNLAIALNNLGMAIAALEDADNEMRKAARQAFGKAYTIANAETEADPNNALAAQRSANIQNNLGMLLRKMGMNHEAAKSLAAAESHIRRASALAPDNEGIAKSLERIQINLSKH